MMENAKEFLKHHPEGASISLLLLVVGQILAFVVWITVLRSEVTQAKVDIVVLKAHIATAEALLPRWAIMEARVADLVKKVDELERQSRK